MKRLIGFVSLLALVVAPAGVAAQRPAATPDLAARCQEKQGAIRETLQSIVDRSKERADGFKEIAERVEAYAETIEPNPQASEIEQQAQAVEARRGALDTSLDTLSADELRCQDPTASIGRLRTDVGTVNKALKEYRAAIRNLIVTTRQAALAAQRTPSPTPSTTPPPRLP